MKLNLTESELSDLKGKHFAFTTNASKKICNTSHRNNKS